MVCVCEVCGVGLWGAGVMTDFEGEVLDLWNLGPCAATTSVPPIPCKSMPTVITWANCNTHLFTWSSPSQDLTSLVDVACKPDGAKLLEYSDEQLNLRISLTHLLRLSGAKLSWHHPQTGHSTAQGCEYRGRTVPCSLSEARAVSLS